MIVFSFLQSSNAFCPIFVTLCGIVIFDRFLHKTKVCSSMVEMLSGIDTETRSSHMENAVAPIAVISFGISSDDMFLHPLKAHLSIVVTLPSVGIVL